MRTTFRTFATILSRIAVIGLLMTISLADADADTSSTDGSTPSNLTPGAPVGSYTLDGFGTVNLFNGNLDFRLPLSDIGGRGSAHGVLTMPVEIRWRTGQHTETSVTGYPVTYNWATYNWWNSIPIGYGPGNMLGRSNSPQPGCGSTLFRLTFTSADGTEYELHDQLTAGAPGAMTPPVNGYCYAQQNRGTVFVTADGSAATFISDVALNDGNGIGGTPYRASGILLLRDGTRYRFDNGLVTWIRDRNGNRITFGYDANGRVISAIDTLNRQVTVTYDITQARPYGQCDQPGYSCDEITYNGFGNSARAMRVTKTTLSNALRSGSTIQSTSALFPGYIGNSSVNPTVTSAVWLPDGRAFKLYYNSYVELSRVELPTGGAVEYDHAAGYSSGSQNGANGYYGIYRRVVEMRTYANAADQNSLESKTTFSRPDYINSSGAVATVGYVEVDHKNAAGTLLSRERHFYNGGAANIFDSPYCPTPYQRWQKGREYQTDWLAADGTTVLRRVNRTWQQRATPSWWAGWVAQNPYPYNQCTSSDEPPGDPRLVETVTRLSDSNQVTKESAINPQTGAVGFDQYNNATDVWEYDYGVGSPPAFPLRHTHTDFLTTNPTNGIDYTADTGAHIRNLATARRVYTVNPSNGSETLAAQSATAYDEPSYPLLTYGSATGWADPGTAARGNATTSSRWIDTSNSWVSTHAQYDQVGNVRNTWDANNGLTQVSYSDSFSDGNNGRNTYAFPTSTTSAIPDPGNTGFGSATPLTTLSAYDFWSGRLTASTDANGKTTTYDYSDPFERLKLVSRPDGGTTSYYYDRYNNGGMVNDYVRTMTALDASNSVTSYQFYDGLGRPNRIFLYEGGSPALYLTRDTQYDAMGRPYRVSNSYRSTGSDSAFNPTGKWTTTAYDSLGRPATVTTADGAVVTTSYSGNTVTVSEPHAAGVVGRQRRSVTDALGRLVRVDEPDASGNLDSGGNPVQPTYYTYDALGNLRRVDQGGQQRFFMYDSLSRLIRVKHPEQAAGSVVSNLTDSVTGNTQWSLAYGYDNNGNLTARVDARDVTTNYGYDALNRNITVRYTDSVLGTSNHTKDIDRHYDGAVNGRGRFYYYDWDANNYARFDTHLAIDEYDEVGRPKNYRQHFLANGVVSPQFTVTRTYDKAGNTLTETYPSGHTVSYSYDAAGRVAGLSGNLGDGVARTYSAGISYDESGGVRQEQFGTQTPLYHKLRYNPRGQLYDVRLSTGSDPDSWNRGMLVNHYGSGDFTSWGTGGPDNNGNVLRSHHYVPNDDQNSSYTVYYQDYEYDTLDRLKKVTEYNNITGTAQYVQGYDYDRWGNRTVNQGVTWGAPNTQFDGGELAGNNRLYAPGDTSLDMSQRRMQYDAAGNLTFDNYTGSGARSYDAENRITSAQDFNNGSTTYAYDADGRRVKRNVDGSETWQVYGIGGELLAEYQSGAAPFVATKEYGYRGGELLVTMASGDPQRMTRFIKNVYYNCLARDPSSTELQQKTDQLAQAGVQSEPQLLAAAKSVARGLFESSEYAARGRTDSQYVTDLYNAYLQRAPDTSGLNFWVQDVQNNGRGHTLNAFEVSTEFATMAETVYGTASAGDNQREDHFIDQLYLGAYNRFPNSTEKQQQEQRLNNAAAVSQSQVVTEARNMGAEIFQATNYNSTHTDSQYVTDLYEAFLQRAPDGPGLNFWVSKVQNEGRASALVGFQNSIEFGALAATLYCETFWLVPDHLGTPRMVVSKTGSLASIKRHDYLPFGGEVFANQGGRTIQQGYNFTDNVRQKFTGYERDGETGLDFAEARYFGSTLGRFTSVDPLGASAKAANPQTFNRYAYALDNPLRHTDSTGMDVDDCDIWNYLIGTAMSDMLNESEAAREPQRQEQQRQQQQQQLPLPDDIKNAIEGALGANAAGQYPNGTPVVIVNTGNLVGNVINDATRVYNEAFSIQSDHGGESNYGMSPQTNEATSTQSKEHTNASGSAGASMEGPKFEINTPQNKATGTQSVTESNPTKSRLASLDSKITTMSANIAAQPRRVTVMEPGGRRVRTAFDRGSLENTVKGLLTAARDAGINHAERLRPEPAKIP
jgi:RHS repeat-associated protein